MAKPRRLTPKTKREFTTVITAESIDSSELPTTNEAYSSSPSVRGYSNDIFKESQTRAREQAQKRRDRFQASLQSNDFSNLSRSDESLIRGTAVRGTGIQPQISGTDVPVSWGIIRNHYMVGNRFQAEDGTWLSEPITLKQLAKFYNVSYDRIKLRSSKEKWGDYRRVYLERLEENNLEHELAYYTQESFSSEVGTMTVSNKLAQVLDVFVESRYKQILEASRDPSSLESIDDDEAIQAQLNRVSATTGTAVFITELAQAVKVADSIFTLQKKVIDSTEKHKQTVNLDDLVGTKASAKVFRNQEERNLKLEQIKQQLLMQKDSQGIYVAVEPVPTEL